MQSLLVAFGRVAASVQTPLVARDRVLMRLHTAVLTPSVQTQGYQLAVWAQVRIPLLLPWRLLGLPT